MKKLVGQLCAALLISAGTAANAVTLELTVGSCPTPVVFRLTDAWSNAYLNEDAADVLRNNPARSALISGVIISEHLPGASLSIMSLGALDSMQGDISEQQFWELAALFEQQVQAPDPAIQSEVQELIDALAAGAEYEGPQYELSDLFLTAPNRFVVLGQTTSSAGDFLVAGLMHLSGSCVVNVQVGVPEAYGLEALLESLYAIHIE